MLILTVSILALPRVPGLNGRSATSPNSGTRGQDIHVRLNYSFDKPASVQVAGEGTLTGYRWEVSTGQDLFLNCKGGDGGDGGRGEDGQQGGKGVIGRNATQYCKADVRCPFDMGEYRY